MAIDHVYRLSTRGRLRGSRVQFGVHFHQPTSTGSPSELAADWLAHIFTLVTPATSAEVNWENIVVSDVTTDLPGDEQYELAIPQPSPGTVSGDCLPGQNSMLISFKTGAKGRRTRGRIFVPGVSEANTANGILTGAQLTALQALGQGIVDRYGPGGTQPNYRVVIHSPPTPPFKPKPAPPVHTDVLITPVRTATADEVVRTQRRRAIGVGE
jgi:hypothetical protein